MLKRSAASLTLLILLALCWASCSKMDQVKTEYIKDYNPIEVGKYITYQLDSTVYVNLNTVKEVHTYIIQDIVDAKITDNLGRDAYRIRRMVRSNVDTTLWNDAASYIIVPTQHALEVIDNNLRYIKLQEPIRNDFTWKGNNYINSFSDATLQYLDAWDYTYENVATPFTLTNGIAFAETISVNERDEVLGNPGDRSFFWEIDKSFDMYAKGKGLVYREFLHEAWQPPNIQSSEGYFEPNSYGIKLTYLNSNY
jgi:hypothetical protein